MTETNQTNLIYKKMVQITKDVGVIGKNKQNTQQHFNFRGIDDVMAQLHDLFAKNEVLVTHDVIESSREERPSKSGGVLIWSIIKFKFYFTTTDGSQMSTEMIGEAMDSGDKASNKAVSIALKYALVNTFLIPTKESGVNDPDASSPVVGRNPTTRPQKQPVQNTANVNLGNCPKCGAPMKMSKQGRSYCSKLCWKTQQPITSEQFEQSI